MHANNPRRLENAPPTTTGLHVNHVIAIMDTVMMERKELETVHAHLTHSLEEEHGKVITAMNATTKRRGLEFSVEQTACRALMK